MKLNNKLMLFEEFVDTKTATSTDVKTSDAKTTRANADVDIDGKARGTEIRTEIVKDVDNIINSLELLSTQVKEELEVLDESVTAAAAGAAALGLGKAGKMLYDAKFKAPKAKKAQSKVNDMLLKITGLELALDNQEPEKKDKIKGKIDDMKSKTKELQDTVDDKYGDGSKIVKKALSAEKKRGKMEVLNMKIDGASPEQQKEIKDSLKELKSKVKADEAAFKDEIEDAKEKSSDEDIQKIKDKEKEDKEKQDKEA